MATSGGGGGGGEAEAPATRRPASKWRELMGRRRARERDDLHTSSNRCSLSAAFQTHDDDLMSLDWTENMRQKCDRIFATGGGEPAQQEENEKARRSQQSRQISSNFQMAQRNRSQNQARPSWSVQKQVNNNCAQLAQWLAELAKIPSPATQEGQQQRQQQQRTQAAVNQTTSACPGEHGGQNQDYKMILLGAEPLDPPQWRMNGTQPSPSPPPQTTTTGTNTANCVCCTWASRHPRERAGQLYEERDGDNLSALSASSSLLSQLLNSSLNQLIEIDNGSSTCCLCDSGRPCGNTGGPALAATTDECNQHGDLTSGQRAQLAAEPQGRSATSEIHLPRSQPPTQQVVDERDLLVVTPMNGSGGGGGARRHSASPAAHQAQARTAKSSDHLTRFARQHQQVRHDDDDRDRPTKSRAQLGGAEHEKTSQVMRAQDGGEQNGAPARRSALKCDQSSIKSSSASCSTLTAAVASDFERLRQQILEVHKRRRASRKRDPAAGARQIGNSQHLLSRKRIGGKQVVDGRQQQFVTFDKDATISQRRRPGVSPERNFMNNQNGARNSAADLLECCREICARTSGTTLTQDVAAPKVKSVADHAQEQRRERPAATGRELAPHGGELINCSLIMGNGQQHDSLLEVSKCARAQSGPQQQRQPLDCSSSSSCRESSLSCSTALAHERRAGSHLAAPQECDRLPPSRSPPLGDYAQVEHAAAAVAASNKCLGKEGAPASLLLESRPFINHLNQRRPRDRSPDQEEATQVFSSCDEQSRTASNAQSSGGGGSISGSGGQSRGSPAGSASISSSEVSLGDSGSTSSCAIRVTNTSGDSSEDCSCGAAATASNSKQAQQQHKLQATSGQLANQEPTRGGGRNSKVPSPLEHATTNDERRRRPVSSQQQRAHTADCSEPIRGQDMGLIGSRQHRHRQCDLVIESQGGSRRELKQYSKQAAHDRRRIDSICNSALKLPADVENQLELSRELDASELCAWESKFAYHPSPSSAGSSCVAQLVRAGEASKRAIPSQQLSDRSELAGGHQQKPQRQTNHYITKHHQLTQAAQLYARNFVALPLQHRLVERPDKQRAEGDEQSGRSLSAAGVIFSLDPSQEAADRASMVEATAQMVRVITSPSDSSSRPSSRASSGAGMRAPATLAGQTNSPRPHNVIDATTLEPIYDVPSLSLVDPPTGQRCLSPDQKYPKVGVAGHLESSTSQTWLDKPARQRLGIGLAENANSELTSQGRETLVGQQVAIIEQKHNQRRRDDDDDNGGQRYSHAGNSRDSGGQILFHPTRQRAGNANSTPTSRETNSESNLGDSRAEKPRRAKDDCDYEREPEMDDDDKHKSSEGGHGEATSVSGGRQRMTTRTAKKKVTCTQPSETITTTTTTTPTNLNARLDERQEPTTIRHARERRPGQSRRDKSQINNLLSRAHGATSASTSPSCSCSTCLETNVDGGSRTVCSSCSCSLGDKSCSCCPSLSLISGHSSSIVAHLLRNQICSCDEDSTDSSAQSPGSLTQAYLRRHQHGRRRRRHRTSHGRHRTRGSRRARQVAVAGGLRSPPRRNARRRHHRTSGPLSISSGRLLRKKLRHMQRRRRRHAHRAHSSRTTDGRRSSHGGHAGCSHGGGGGQLAPRPANANSYKVFANDQHEQEQVRARSVIGSAHATGAPSKLTAAAKSGAGGQRHTGEPPLEVLDEEEEELAEGGGSDQRRAQKSEIVGGEPTGSQVNLKTFNEQPPDDRGGLIIGRHTRARRRDQQPPSELDGRANERKPTRRRVVANLLLSRNRALAGRGAQINATTATPPRAGLDGSPNDDLNQHADDQARPRVRATSGRQRCRLCRPTGSELSCGSSCSQLTMAVGHHRPRHHGRRKSHHGASRLDAATRAELDKIRSLRRRRRKLIRRLLEVGEAQEISPSTDAAASKQLKIEYLSRQVGAVARELKSRRRSYKSRVRHHRQQQRHRRNLERAPSRRFNKPLAAAGGSHDTIRADRSRRRHWTNEGYPAASKRGRNSAASGLLRWRRLARPHRPISGGCKRARAAGSSLSYSPASCCRGGRRRCSLTSSSCVSGSLVTSLSRGAHLRTGEHIRRHQRRRQQPGRNRPHLGRNHSHYVPRPNGARPRRATETNDDSALQAAAAARASLNDRNMTTARSAAPGQTATVGQLRNLQQALIASGHTTRTSGGGGGRRRITWERSRHELNPTLTLVAAHERNGRRRTSSPSGRRRRAARKSGRPERSNNPANYVVGDSKFNMDKFLVKRVDPSAVFARVAAATTGREISQPHPLVPFTWQLTNHCQCKHCCLVGALVRMDLEGAAMRRRKTSDFNGGVENRTRAQQQV